MPAPYRDFSNPFGFCFNAMKIRYQALDESLTAARFLQPQDKVNVFINLETIFKNLSMINDLEQKLILQKKFPVILVSDIINLAAHYKRFFINNGLDTRVYLYHTDFKSDDFDQCRYNEDFRSYYLMKYNENPRMVYLTDAMKSDIFPEVRTICEFVPRVYYISAHNIEGSAVPHIIGDDDPTRKNIIISGEFYDTQYTLLPNYFVQYIHYALGARYFYSDTKSYLKAITKRNGDELESLNNTYSHPAMYSALLAVLGDRARSIDGLAGVGPKILQKNILNSIQENRIQLTTTSPNLLGDVFHDMDMKDEFINNFYCVSIPEIAKELTPTSRSTILNQRRDRFDNNSLIRLNSSRFYNYPLILEALTL
jgi:hypothetical protein